MKKDLQLILEVKTQSPFGFKSDKSWDELFLIADNHADIISIHTDIRWGGDFNLIRKAKSLTNKKILAKGIHNSDDDIINAINCGADFVLVVGRVPKVALEKCFIEVNSLKELESLPHNIKAVWNTRDLETGNLKKETFEEARQIFQGWLCQASNIKNTSDIKEGADAILVGQNLETFCNSL